MTLWLRFRDAELRDRFLSAWPSHDLTRRLETLRNGAAALAQQIERRVARGDFDLGRFGSEHRLGVAQTYVRLAAELREHREHIEAWELTAQLSERWQDEVEVERWTVPG